MGSSLQSTLLTYAGSLLAGAVVGAVVVTLAMPDPRSQAASEPAAATRALAASCDEVEAEVLEPLRGEVAEAELRAKVLRGQLALIGGIPELWPDGVDVEAERAALLDAAQAAVDAHLGDPTLPVEIQVDCDEAPCILKVMADLGDDPFVPRLPEDLREELKQVLGATGWTRSFVRQPGESDVVELLTFAPDQSSEEPARVERTRVRLERIHSQEEP